MIVAQTVAAVRLNELLGLLLNKREQARIPQRRKPMSDA